MSAPQDPEERARQHHPLEADVHDAAPLAEDAADGRERERGREAEHRRGQGRPDDDHVQVRDARAGARGSRATCRGCPRRRRRAPSRRTPARSAIDAEQDRRQADQRGSDRRAHLQRRQRHPEREQADQDPGDRDGAGAAGQRARGSGRSQAFRRARARAPSPPPAEDVQDEHVGAHEEDDEALDDVGQVRRPARAGRSPDRGCGWTCR